MVGESDELADAVALGYASSSIGEYHGAEAESAKNAHGEGDLLRRVPLVEVDTTLHDDDRDSAKQAGDDAA